MISLQDIVVKKKYGSRSLLTLVYTFIILLVISVILAGVIGKSYSMEIASFNRGEFNPSEIPNGFNGILIYGNFSAIDEKAFRFNTHFQVKPAGSYIYLNDPLHRTLDTDISITIEAKTTIYARGDLIYALEDSLSFQTMTPEDYPFDSYFSEFYIECYQIVNVTESLNIPLSISIQNGARAWNTEISLVEISSTLERSVLKVTVDFKRNASQLFFCFFVVLLLWTMSILTFMMSFTHLRYSKRVESPTLGMVTTMLFALPAVRNMLPGTPVIGCLSDLVGFFWNMGLVATSAILLIWRFSFQDISKPKLGAPDNITSSVLKANKNVDFELGNIRKSVQEPQRNSDDDLEMHALIPH